MTKEQEDLLVEMLGYVYASVPWGKMKTSKNPYDIFNHRVRAASRRRTIYEMLSKLCNYFGLQQAPVEAIEIADKLRDIENEVLNKIYLEHIPISMKSILRGKQIKEERINKAKGLKNLFD